MPTNTILHPAHAYEELLSSTERYDLSSLRGMIVGGAAAPQWMIQDQQFAIRARQGIPVPGIEIRAIDEQGQEIAWDGKVFGELQVRGPWVIRSYYNDKRSVDAFNDSWFRTGIVVTNEPGGLYADRGSH